MPHSTLRLGYWVCPSTSEQYIRHLEMVLHCSSVVPGILRRRCCLYSASTAVDVGACVHVTTAYFHVRQFNKKTTLQKQNSSTAQL